MNIKSFGKIADAKIKSPLHEQNGDLSPGFAWRFWRKFLAMGSTGNGAALGRFQVMNSDPVKFPAAS
ncbi:hypothetical protein JY97_13320 [Alkalispirochaeta odontotermitis]|nr:hypothetical protein JY97_13320 [Alkalispirochaeta odontotermitis]CAB1079504.1 hypothetical protein D1AOALGA4SA_7214 [Olavius algarvensis Delta 1 endosymbiont]